MKRKILVVDDDQVLRMMLQAMLERKDYRVVLASNGREGLQKACQTRPDLVLLDIMMPEMDGWEVCRRLRELSSVPIIMLTARNVVRDVVTGLESGAFDVRHHPRGGWSQGTRTDGRGGRRAAPWAWLRCLPGRSPAHP
jgi:DNA-binding response OmpR family regulator